MWDDDVISQDNYVMMSKQLPFWILHLEISKFFRNVNKLPKITEKYSITNEMGAKKT